MKNKREVLVKLFLSTLYLSAFTFGGGYVIVTLMKKKFVDQYHWIEETPVIMISAEDSYTFVERAYDLGASDYITRPFDARVVCRRVSNTLMLYAK